MRISRQQMQSPEFLPAGKKETYQRVRSLLAKFEDMTFDAKLVNNDERVDLAPEDHLVYFDEVDIRSLTGREARDFEPDSSPLVPRDAVHNIQKEISGRVEFAGDGKLHGMDVKNETSGFELFFKRVPSTLTSEGYQYFNLTIGDRYEPHSLRTHEEVKVFEKSGDVEFRKSTEGAEAIAGQMRRNFIG